VSHPDALPDLFLDRSLGRIQVPRLLREAGLRLVTLAEHYGIPADEDVADTTWLRDAGTAGWVVFMKDSRIRRTPAERAELVASRVRAFCLTRKDLTAPEMAARFLDRLPAITAACAEPGPLLYAVHASRIERLRLD
jgi:hypothetical protein